MVQIVPAILILMVKLRHNALTSAMANTFTLNDAK